MSKGLKSYPKGDQILVAQDRLHKKTGGLGELAAKDWLDRLGSTVGQNRKRPKINPETEIESVPQ